MSTMYTDLLQSDETDRAAGATLRRDARHNVRVVVLPEIETAIIGRACREPLTSTPLTSLMDDLLEATWEDAEWQ